MNTAVINIKVEPDLKTEAKKVASKLGFSLSSLINGYLRQLVKSERIEFCLKEEKPSEYLIQALRQSEEERNRGKFKSFKSTDEALAFVDKIINGRNTN